MNECCWISGETSEASEAMPDYSAPDSPQLLPHIWRRPEQCLGARLAAVRISADMLRLEVGCGVGVATPRREVARAGRDVRRRLPPVCRAAVIAEASMGQRSCCS